MELVNPGDKSFLLAKEAIVDVKVKFFFFLGAVVCFALAAIGEGWRYGARSRKGLAPAIALIPLGLALLTFPSMWDAGVAAF